MVRKRGLDNVYERSKKRYSWSHPSTDSNKEKNMLSDNLLNLYRQVAEVKSAILNQNEVIMEDNNNKNIQTDKLKNVEISETPSKSVRKGNIKALTLEYPSITFDDVGGMENELMGIFQMCMDLKESHVFQAKGFPPIRGYLLHGPPGSGKTHLVRAIAGELQLPFIEMVATELVCGTSGESKRKIRGAFNEAIKIGKCILFIDNIEAICPKRETTDRDIEKQMVNEIVNCFNELNKKDTNFNVKVIGATNIREYIDPALRKSNRFDRESAIGIPNEDTRLKIIQVLYKKVEFGTCVDLAWIAHNTPGFVASDLKALLTEVMQVGILRMQKELCDSNYNGDSSLLSVRNWLQCISTEDLKKYCAKLEDFKVALQNYIPYCKREGFASVPNVTWDDIGALENVKSILCQTILWPVKYRKTFEDNHFDSIKGILFYGPKGCGKTLLAKAIANECNINFLCVNGAELLSMYLGESEKAVIKCFERARNSAPCVIFFDEFDALCPTRSNSKENLAAERVVNQLLTEMDGTPERKEVFVIAATNRPDKIDPAMRRPGRLENQIYVGLPSPAGRLEILKSLTRNKTRPKIADELDLESIALDPQCNDFSGADLAYLIRKASAKAMEEYINSFPLDSSKLVLTMNHFKSALKVVKPSLSEEDKIYFEKYRMAQKTNEEI